MKVHLDEIES
jgi:hypothetical protein